LVERFFNRSNAAAGLPRYDKLAANYLAFVAGAPMAARL